MKFRSVGDKDKALLFLHGFGGAGPLWAFQVEALRDKARCVTVDLPGHGECVFVQLSTLQMAQEISRYLEAEGLRDVHVVASSFGGLIALRLWEQRPELVRAFTFVGSLPCFVYSEEFPAGLDEVRINKLARQLLGQAEVVMDMFFRSVFTMKERESRQYAKVKALRAGLAVPKREALFMILEMLRHEDLRDILATVTVPVQVVTGDQDPICPLASVERWTEGYPLDRLCVMKGCGHFPFLSRPEEFNTLLEEFASL